MSLGKELLIKTSQEIANFVIFVLLILSQVHAHEFLKFSLNQCIAHLNDIYLTGYKSKTCLSEIIHRKGLAEIDGFHCERVINMIEKEDIF